MADIYHDAIVGKKKLYAANGDLMADFTWTPGTHKTATLTTGMTMAEANAEINQYGKYIPPGSYLYIALPSGTMTVDASLIQIYGFWGGGYGVYMYGPGNSNTLHTTQTGVIGSATNTGPYVSYNNVPFVMVDVKLTTSGNAAYYMLNCWNNPGRITIQDVMRYVRGLVFHVVLSLTAAVKF